MEGKVGGLEGGVDGTQGMESESTVARNEQGARTQATPSSTRLHAHMQQGQVPHPSCLSVPPSTATHHGQNTPPPTHTQALPPPIPSTRPHFLRANPTRLKLQVLPDHHGQVDGRSLHAQGGRARRLVAPPPCRGGGVGTALGAVRVLNRALGSQVLTRQPHSRQAALCTTVFPALPGAQRAAAVKPHAVHVPP